MGWRVRLAVRCAQLCWGATAAAASALTLRALWLRRRRRVIMLPAVLWWCHGVGARAAAVANLLAAAAGLPAAAAALAAPRSWCGAIAASGAAWALPWVWVWSGMGRLPAGAGVAQGALAAGFAAAASRGRHPAFAGLAACVLAPCAMHVLLVELLEFADEVRYHARHGRWLRQRLAEGGREGCEWWGARRLLLNEGGGAVVAFASAFTVRSDDDDDDDDDDAAAASLTLVIQSVRPGCMFRVCVHIRGAHLGAPVCAHPWTPDTTLWPQPALPRASHAFTARHEPMLLAALRIAADPRRLRDAANSFFFLVEPQRACARAPWVREAARVAQAALHDADEEARRARCVARCDAVRGELMAAAWHPRRMRRWCLEHDDAFAVEGLSRPPTTPLQWERPVYHMARSDTVVP